MPQAGSVGGTHGDGARCQHKPSEEITAYQSGDAKRLKETFANEADARAAAQAEWRRITRGAATFELHLALGQPLLTPQTPVKVSGWKKVIDDTDWLSLKVWHTMTPDGGFTTHVELEMAAALAQQLNIVEEE